MFTSAGVDACLRRLLRDVLPVLVPIDGTPARGAYIKHLLENRLKGEVSRATKEAITAIEPLERLIDLYVADLTGASLQRWQDLQKIRTALGLPKERPGDDRLRNLEDFFNARNEIAHELDLINPSGPGNRRRRHRDMQAVGDQCNRVICVIEEFIRGASEVVKASGRRDCSPSAT